MTKEQRLAKRIVDDLFLNGQGEVATRLVLIVDGDPPRDLGGWCKRAAQDRIATLLRGPDAAPRPTEKGR